MDATLPDIKEGNLFEMKNSGLDGVQEMSYILRAQMESQRLRNVTPSGNKLGEKEVNVTWRELGYEFTQYTTLHGLRYVAHRDTFILRRIFWLLLTLICSCLLVLQIVDRVRYLLHSPIAVNIKVNYNQSLQFPAITICNQNAFRATAASDLGLYRLIEDMYRDEIIDSRNTTWLSPSHWNIGMDELYTNLGHKKEDFIVSCSWAGEKCTAQNFSTTLTDHGMCHTFNGFVEGKPPLNAAFSGTEHGLHLTLNAERYNVMPGPHDASGIKLLATAQSQFPRVEEVGVAIPTGAHAFVGLSILVINNLPKPHGDCGEKTLVSSNKYTPEMCILECVTRYVGVKCGCRNFYMPDMKENLPVCTIKQYFDCYFEAYEYIKKRTVDECDCPTSCYYLLYESSISYATTSANVKGNLLGLAKSEDLQNKFRTAREITSKMNTAILTQFQDIVQVTIENYTKLKRLFAYDIVNCLDNQLNLLKEWKENMTSSINRKQLYYEYQEYSIQKNFMRARDAMEERTFNMLCVGFHEHVFNTELLLRQTYDAVIFNKSSAFVTYTFLKNILRGKIETAGRASQNYTQIYSAYETGQPIFNYKFKTFPRKDNTAIVPKPLLNNSLFHNAYARLHSKRFGAYIQRVSKWTHRFELLTDAVYNNHSDSFDTLEMRRLSLKFIDACEDYFHSKSTFYFESVDRPVRVIQERMQKFSSSKRDFDLSVDEQVSALRTLKNSLSIIKSGLLYDLANGITLAEKYFIENATTHSVTKLQLAEVFTSKAVSNNLHILSLFFTEMRQKGQFIHEQWRKIKSASLKIWETILEDIDSIEYYEYKKIEDFLQNFTQVNKNLDLMVKNIQDDNDLRNIMRNTDNVFVKAIEKLTEELRDFLHSNKMGDAFIRENFLQLDIYYKELRHEEIEQQRAYDAIALLCDIGGSIGLFIGASVLTIFEILDFFISNAFIKLMKRNRRT